MNTTHPDDRRLKWLIWSIVLTLAAALGIVLGASGALAHAATSASAPVVYGAEGRAGFNDPRARPTSFVILNGGVESRRDHWRKWGTTGLTRSAQSRECGSTCTKWARDKFRFYDVKTRKVRNLGGGWVTIRFYTELEQYGGGGPFWYAFGKDGTKVMQWYQRACSVHGGPCTGQPAARPTLTSTPLFPAGGHGPARCKWYASGRKSHGYLSLRLRTDHCRRNQLRIRAAGEGVLPARFYTGNWIDRVPQLTSINISPNVFSNYGWDQQYCWRIGPGCRHKGKVRFVSADNGARP